MQKKYILFLILILILIYVFLKKESTPKLSPYEIYANLIPNTYRLGYTNLEKEINIQKLPIQGQIPIWLSGTLLRNGPAKFCHGKSFISNWLDGLAMLHAFKFNNGKVSYANKFLITDAYKSVKKNGKMSYIGFAQDPCQSFFRKIATFFFKYKQGKQPNANVNIVKYTNKYLALTEIPLPVEFDFETLTTLGPMYYEDTNSQGNVHETAHPHYDPIQKEHLTYITKFGRTSSHNLYRIKDGTTKRTLIASIEVKEPSYMHSFAITENYAIFSLIPLIVNPFSLIIMEKGFIKNFKWKPEQGTTFVVINRKQNKIVDSFNTKAFFTFHHVNAYEQNDNIIVDIVIYKNPSEIENLNLKNLLAPQDKFIKNNLEAGQLQNGILQRFVIDLQTKKVTSKQICDEIVELPRINYDNYNGKKYKYAYMGSTQNVNIAYFDKLLKVNVDDGSILSWKENFCYPGEPVFIQSPNSDVEDDGVILSIVLNAKKSNSFLLVLDAKSMKEIGRAVVPHHIPFGLHGNYF